MFLYVSSAFLFVKTAFDFVSNSFLFVSNRINPLNHSVSLPKKLPFFNVLQVGQ